jgi:osmotically-inducible protein OsmY
MKQHTIQAWLFAAVIIATLMAGTPLRATERDEQVIAAFKQSYVYKTYLKNDTINIAVIYDGVVVLTGTVADETHKTLAGETMSGLPWVSRVDNQLATSFNTAVSAGNDDAWIAKKVRLALLLHRNVTGASNLSVVVKDGVVTLAGEAPSAVLIERATVYAKDIEGVKDVRNNMTVAARPGPTELTESETLDDASVTAHVKMALLIHRSTKSAEPKVSTRNGQVTLTGLAKSTDEKNQITEVVSDIQGVTSVKNLMKIENVTGK